MQDVLSIIHHDRRICIPCIYICEVIKNSFRSAPVQNVSQRSEQEFHQRILNACQIIRTSTGFLTVWTDRGKPYQA
jgi:hypothetical protein